MLFTKAKSPSKSPIADKATSTFGNQFEIKILCAEFKILCAEYETLFNAPSSTPDANSAERTKAKGIIDEHSQNPPETLDWHTVYRLHLCLLHLYPEPRLERAQWELRERYKDMFGEPEFKEYLASNQPDPNKKCSRDLILADLDQLLGIFYTNYQMGPHNSRRLRRKVVVTMLVIVGTLTVFGVLRFVLPSYFRVEPFGTGITILTVCFAGAMGGFLSYLQRLRQLGVTGDSLTDFHELQIVGTASIFAAGAIGALFAGVLYFLFKAELLKGGLFPDLSKTPNAQILAQLYAWAFLAGFSERLVPDTLNRLLAKKTESGH
jgi:hypothetical protein